MSNIIKFQRKAKRAKKTKTLEYNLVGKPDSYDDYLSHLKDADRQHGGMVLWTMRMAMGFDPFVCREDDRDIYEGTMSLLDNGYLALSMEDDGRSLKVNVTFLDGKGNKLGGHMAGVIEYAA